MSSRDWGTIELWSTLSRKIFLQMNWYDDDVGVGFQISVVYCGDWLIFRCFLSVLFNVDVRCCMFFQWWCVVFNDDKNLFLAVFSLSWVASLVVSHRDHLCFRFSLKCVTIGSVTIITTTVAEWPHWHNNPLLWHCWTSHCLLVLWHQVRIKMIIRNILNLHFQEVHGEHHGDEDPDAKVPQVLLDALLGHCCSCHLLGNAISSKVTITTVTVTSDAITTKQPICRPSLWLG